MLTVTLATNTLYYPKGGGHFWVYLNWALGLKSNGCNIIWLEGVNPETTKEDLRLLVENLQKNLSPYGLEKYVALYYKNNKAMPEDMLFNCMDIDIASESSNLIINQVYNLPESILKRFKKSVLLDIDPGLFQVWISKGYFNVADHNLYFTIGETVGQTGAKFPNLGLNWHYTPPCVSLNNWPVTQSLRSTSYSTVSHWSMDEWEDDNGEIYSNDKRTGFLPYLELPLHVNTKLELALFLSESEQSEKEMLKKLGWKVTDSQTETSTPENYQNYIQNSRGEFSCVKPSCVRLQNAWISDRTICYLASGKPVIVENTGPSRFLPDDAGLLRFRNIDEAIKCIKEAEENYDKHSRFARGLAEEYFDAKKVTAKLLEKAL